MNRMVHFILAGAAATTLSASAAGQVSLGTEFTYQGDLKAAGQSVNSTADFEFALFDAAVGGNMVGGAVSVSDVDVVDGRFTVALDFGSGVFNGEARWIEIALRSPAGAGPFTLLTPRQAITAVPYALQTRGVFVAEASGHVGIGTNNPLDELHVAGDSAALRLQDDDDPGSYSFLEDWQAAILRLIKVAGTGNALIDLNPIPLDGTGAATVRIFRETNTTGSKRVQFYRGDDTNAASAQIGVDGADSYFQIHGGNVGIGTAAPLRELHIAADGSPIIMLEDTSVGGRTFHLGVASSNGSFRIAETGVADRLTVSGEGNVGIGTTDPSFPLSLGSSISHTKIALYETGATNSYGMGVVAGTFSFHLNGSGARYAFFNNDDFTNEVFTIRGSGNVGIGTPSPGAKLDVRGTTRTEVIEITGADVAERFPTSEGSAIEPGTVMEIDPENPGRLRISSEAYNRRVAGVVSGAGELPTGAVLGHLPGSENGPPIALSGRVWVRCDAGRSAIDPGDLLTTADAAGMAMKVMEPDRAHGAVIGKAMTGLPRGETGLVLVLVNLQ